MTDHKHQPKKNQPKEKDVKPKPNQLTYSETFVDTAPMGEWRNHPKD